MAARCTSARHSFLGGSLPTYSYACTACDHRFDILEEFTDEALTICPDCAGRLRKVFGSIGVSFKGSGFYRTDHGSENSAAVKSDSSKAKSDSGGSKDSNAPKNAGGSQGSDKSSGAKTSASSSAQPA